MDKTPVEKGQTSTAAAATTSPGKGVANASSCKTDLDGIFPSTRGTNLIRFILCMVALIRRSLVPTKPYSQFVSPTFHRPFSYWLF